MSAARDKKLPTRRQFLGTSVLGGAILSRVPPMLQYLSAAAPGQESAENDTGFLELRSSFFLAKIDCLTGGLEQLTSLSPSRKDLPPGGFGREGSARSKEPITDAASRSIGRQVLRIER